VTESTAESVHSENSLRQDNAYTALGGLPTIVAVPETRVQRAKEVGSVAYEGVKLALQALYDTTSMCPPLKTAVAGLLTIIKLVDGILENKKEFDVLHAKLQAILSIVEKYKKHHGLGALNHRIDQFCDAITLQINEVKKLQSNNLATRAARSAKDSDTILKAFRNISNLCDVFQIDTQLHTEVTAEDIDGNVKDIIQRLRSGDTISN